MKHNMRVVGAMKEEISALVDGELDERTAAQLIQSIGRDAEALEAWRSYHLVGDALRQTPQLSEQFAVRVAAALAAEPTVLAPRRLPRPEPRRWYALAASLAAVALVGWLAFVPEQTAVAPMALAPVANPTSGTKPASVPLPSGTSDYLLAHQGFSPRVSLQGVAPYVRTVSEQAQEQSR